MSAFPSQSHCNIVSVAIQLVTQRMSSMLDVDAGVATNAEVECEQSIRQRPIATIVTFSESDFNLFNVNTLLRMFLNINFIYKPI